MTTLRLYLVESLSERQTPDDTLELPKNIILHGEPNESVTIGRENSTFEVGYVLGDYSRPRVVSRHHATLEYRLEERSFYLTDHSINGTYVNYTRISNDGMKLEDEDIVCFHHSNGANIEPGETVEPFDTRLKYIVELFDEQDQNMNENNEDDTHEESQLKLSKERSVKKSNKRNTVKKTKKKAHSNKRAKKKKFRFGKKSRVSRAVLVQDEEELCAAGFCMRPIGLVIDWICCDKCSNWYHQMCVGIRSPKTIDLSKPYFCTSCK